MIRPLLRPLAFLLSLAGCAGPLADARHPACQADKQAELPVTVVRNFLLVPAALDGTRVMMVVDTGAEASMVTPEAVERLSLAHDPDHRSVLMGVAGTVRSDNIRLRRLQLGSVLRTDQSVGLGTIGSFGGTSDPVSGLIGADVLTDYDVDIDGPGRRLSLYAVGDCPGFRPPGFATGLRASGSLPLARTRGGLLFLPVLVDGRPVRALLDTGARTTLISHRVAGELGVTDEMLMQDPARVGQGVGHRGIVFRQHRFAELRVGDAVEHDRVMNVAELPLVGVDMLLGADWLGARRVWISNAAGRLFVR